MDYFDNKERLLVLKQINTGIIASSGGFGFKKNKITANRRLWKESIIPNSKFKLAYRAARHWRVIARESKQEVRRESIVRRSVANYENNNYRGLPAYNRGIFFLNNGSIGWSASYYPVGEDYGHNVGTFYRFFFFR